MDKKQLIERIKKGDYTHDQLLGWVMSLPGSVGTKKPIKNKIGDIYMHPVFQHPYVLLAKKKNNWICGLLTTDETCDQILEPCKSRFFTASFFTKVLITMNEPTGSYCNVYDNNSHIRHVIKQLRDLFS